MSSNIPKIWLSTYGNHICRRCQLLGFRYVSSPGENGAQQVIVLLKPSREMGQSLYGLVENVKASIPNPVKGLSGVEVEITSTLLSFYSLLIDDTSFLVDRLIIKISSLVSVPPCMWLWRHKSEKNESVSRR